MGDGFWLFLVVRRGGPHRRLACVHGIACCAAYAWDRRIGRVSLLCEDAGAARSGSRARICKRADRCRSWMRPGPGHVFWWDAHGAVRMAPLLHRPGPRQHGLADSLVCLDAAKRDRHFARGEKQRRVSRALEATIDVGDLRGLVWRELCAVLRDHLVAVLSRA